MKSLYTRIGTISVALAAVVALTGVGCNQGAEGDRCNPDLSAGHDECGSGLRCTQPVDCPENYCCPTSGQSSNPYCQPGCNGGLASICAADPSFDACAADAAPESAAGDGGADSAGSAEASGGGDAGPG